MVAEFIPVGEADVMFWKYGLAVSAGALRLDPADLRRPPEILELANSAVMTTRSGRRVSSTASSWRSNPNPTEAVD